MHRISKILIIPLALLYSFAICCSPSTTFISEENSTTAEGVVNSTQYSQVEPISGYTQPPVETTILVTEEEQISDDDIELIALVTMAEAEGECEEGKRLVIDTILNRVDSEHFPDTVYEVVYQPNQFSPMWNGRVERCVVKEDIVGLVMEELKFRTDYDVIFFTAGRYSKYGVPMFQVENHYFSSYG